MEDNLVDMSHEHITMLDKKQTFLQIAKDNLSGLEVVVQERKMLNATLHQSNNK
jgi:hypothetical protein